ncbi:MAG: M56 family metallopeptidase [Lachnospiraceae bacterium]|nr:M56 family metallopeptidase [Lachnospiraceae bacterium]
MYYVMLAIFAVVISCIVLYHLLCQIDAASLKPEDPRADLSAYRPAIAPDFVLQMFILCFVFLIFGRLLLFPGSRQSGYYAISAVCGGFLVNALILMLIYYSAMLPLFPLLKRKLSPASCAVLWILPNVLYVMCYLTQFLRENGTPRLVLRLKGTWPLWLLGIWLAGFMAVMGYSIISHLRFRRQLLADAVSREDPLVQKKWTALKREYKLNGKKYPRPLYRSASLATPLSVGLLNSTTCVILPEKEYTEDELDLILRHELLHLIHRDPQAKLFIRFSQALFWFNPLIWLSGRSLSEDLERTCDELVLGDAPEEMRQQYAGLLLQNAADPCGFTTCLSASARSLKDRLTEVLHPVRRRKGVLLILLMIIALIVSSGRFVLAYGDGKTVKSELLDGESFYPDTWKTVYFYENSAARSAGEYKIYVCRDPEAFSRAVEDLPVYRTLGMPSPGTGPRIVTDPVRTGSVMYSSYRVMEISKNYLLYTASGSYYVETEDWERLFALFEELSEEKAE